MININLLPWRDEERKLQKKYFLKNLSVFCAASLVVIVIAHIFIAIGVSTQNKINQQLQTKIDLVKQQNNSLSQSMADAKEVSQKAVSLKALSSNRETLLNAWHTIYKALPKNTTLTKIHFACVSGRANVELNGITNSNQAVSQFMQNISSSGIFEQPVLNEIVDSKQDQENPSSGATKAFSLKTSIKDKRCQ